MTPRRIDSSSRAGDSELWKQQRLQKSCFESTRLTTRRVARPSLHLAHAWATARPFQCLPSRAAQSVA
jgi:hypothetical protein